MMSWGLCSTGTDLLLDLLKNWNMLNPFFGSDADYKKYNVHRYIFHKTTRNITSSFIQDLRGIVLRGHVTILDAHIYEVI